MDDHTRDLLHDARRQLSDAEAEISEAVSSLEHDDGTDAEDFLGSAMTRLKVLDERLKRHLDEGGPEA